MAGIRIRWRGVARVAAIVLVAVIGLRLLPGLLRAPEPPPLGADVGLPQAAPEPEEPRPVKHRRSRSQKSRLRPVPDAPAAEAVIGIRRRHRIAKRAREHPARRQPDNAESLPPPSPEYVPPPAPEPIAEPLPEPPPAPRFTPGDGSEEFAPH